MARPRLARAADDPWLTRRMQEAATVARGELAMVDAVDAAYAAALTEVWRVAMDTPGSLTAATVPDPESAIQAAREAWTRALADFLQPILTAILGDRWQGVYEAVMKRVPDAELASYAHLATVPNRLVERYWRDQLERIGRSIDAVVDDMRESIADALSRGESVNRIRDRVARILQIDAGSRELRDRIEAVERRMRNPHLSEPQRDDLLSQRADILHELFLVRGRRATARARLRLAEALEAHAGRLPEGEERDDLLRRAADARAEADRINPSDADIQAVNDRLRRVDNELYENPDLTPDERDALRNRRSNLYEQLRADEHGWHYRARRIARTETIGTLNSGTVEAAEVLADATGLDLEKRWLATSDYRTRPSHVAADEQVVPIAAPFNVGGAALQFPGDPTGPPNEVIQCRCTVLLEETDGEDVRDSIAASGGTMHTITRTVVAAVTGKLDLPVADRGRAWDGPAAAGRVLDAATNNDGEINVEQASRAFLLRDGDGSNRGDYKLGFADIIDGELTIVPRAVSTLAGGHGVDAVKGISTDERDRLKSRVCTLYGHVRDAVDDWPECPFDTSSSRTAATTVNEPIPSQPTEAMRPLVVDAAEGAPYEPPDDWFTDPGLPMATPLVVTRDGRVMGHVADWETCHAGYADVCVRAPHSASGYAYYHYGPVFTASGRTMTGKLTVGGGHADANANLRAAIEHYDDVSTSVAVVRAGEDQHGIWVAGAIRPGATPEQVYDLLSSPLSGDWRVPHDGSSLEMIAAHAVNVPGFGIRASATMGPNGQISLVSAGVLTPRPELSLDPGVLERQRRVAALTASVGRDPASRIRAAEAAIGMDPASRADRLAASIGLN